eukprot:SAG22_NODE_428_length_10591_cov_8.858178_5_plen_276_part_00
MPRTVSASLALALFAGAAGAGAAGANSSEHFAAVASFAVVTSDQTVERFLGAGLPAEYIMALPHISALVRHYLNSSQTLGFINVQSGLQGAGGLAERLRQHKVVVLPETSLGDGDTEWGAAAVEALVEYAEDGGTVVVAGGGTLQGGPAAAKLSAALGLELVGPSAGSTTQAGSSGGVQITATIDNSSNPEWWRLASAPPPFAADRLHTVRVVGTETLVLATAAVTPSHGGGGGSAVPLLTARRAGQRGWLTYTAASGTYPSYCLGSTRRAAGAR